jgi:hypothetical protein
MMRTILVFTLLIPASSRADDIVEFNRDVRPILSEACFACHGFDAKARKARLRLDVPEGAFAERKGTVPIQPGKPAASEAWARITSTDPDQMMPPPRANKKLTASQKDLIRKWIEQGAKYQKHWSFEPVRRPPVPEISGASSEIDAFLLRRLRQASLTPQPRADRETLLRRVSFALTGLPPTAQELDAWLADQSPMAYENMVDRYLASPQYGEEMARHWLDVARYADTHGLHLDNERLIWAYRDWVVKAFNENLPFDRFTVWQLAGDLLPNPTRDQLAATGFNRCNVTTGEGGSIESEWVYRNAVDRTSTAVQAWLGMTAGCAVCHDHKYDPLTTREYYSLYAFFLSASGPALDGNTNTTGPFTKLPTMPQKAALEAAIRAEADARKRLEAAAAKAAETYADPADTEPAPAKQKITQVLLDDVFPLAASDRNTSRNAADWLADPAFGAKSGRRVLRQANSFFHQDTIDFRLQPIVIPASGRFEAWLRRDPKSPPTAVAIQFGGAKVWWGTKPESKTDKSYGGGGLGVWQGPLPAAGEWGALRLDASKVGLKEGQAVASLTLQEYGGLAYWDAITLSGEIEPARHPLASFRVWWKRFAGKAPPELPAELRKTLAAGPDGKHAPEAETGLLAFYLAHVAPGTDAELASRQEEWQKARADRELADAAIPGSLVFGEMAAPREAFVMMRGQYDKRGDKVVPGVPAVLPPLTPAKPGERPTRLDLANWLVAPENPLVARVAVNRLWQQFFGIGLVKTSADFGTQGELPSHPELLDWLAAEFRDGGWNTKDLVRRLLLSDAFQRSSRQDPAMRTLDPENRLLGRGPRFRLDAEQVRDNALFVSGLMNLEMGGRAVRPYQPPNIWEPIGYGDSNTRYYLQDHGAALYRRSLYVFIKRTAPHPFLSNFDAPNREQLCAVRDRTNTPLQALQLMNDVQHFEAARALAERTLTEAEPTTDRRIDFLYRTVLSRQPASEEIRLVADVLGQQRALYQADPAAARKVVHVGESQPRGAASDEETAAWTMIANMMLNLDETLNRN